MTPSNTAANTAVEWADPQREAAFRPGCARSPTGWVCCPRPCARPRPTPAFAATCASTRRPGDSLHRHGRAAREGKLPALRARGHAHARGRPAGARRAGLGRAAGLHAAERPGPPDLLERIEPDNAAGQPRALHAGHRHAAGLAARLQARRAAGLRRSPAAPRTAAVPRLVSAAAQRRRAERHAGQHPAEDLRRHRRSTTWPRPASMCTATSCRAT